MTAHCDPGDCTAACGHCIPTAPRLTDAEAIAHIMVAGRGVEEHKRRWQNGFISEAAYQAAVAVAITEIQRVLKEAGR